jgi:BMFP domain-containing protein YqiC
MAKASNDLFSTLRTYISKVTEGEKSPAEVAAALNSWARESADALKAKINEEVEASVAKMGFVKRDEFDRLAAQVAALKSSQSSTSSRNTPTKRTAKKAPVKKAPIKKAPTRKTSPKKSSSIKKVKKAAK